MLEDFDGGRGNTGELNEARETGDGGGHGGADKNEEAFLREAILAHAEFLGIDPVEDEEFLYIAEEALTAPLPEGWEQGFAEDGTPYHFNPTTKESLWEHPLDEHYRNMFRDLKAKKLVKQKSNPQPEREKPSSHERQNKALSHLGVAEIAHMKNKLSEKAAIARADAILHEDDSHGQIKPKQGGTTAKGKASDWFDEVAEIVNDEDEDSSNDKMTVQNQSQGWSDAPESFSHEQVEESRILQGAGSGPRANGAAGMGTSSERSSAPSRANEERTNASGVATSRDRKGPQRGAGLREPNAGARSGVTPEHHHTELRESREKIQEQKELIVTLRQSLDEQRQQSKKLMKELRDMHVQNEEAMDELTALHEKEVEELVTQMKRTGENADALKAESQKQLQATDDKLTHLREENTRLRSRVDEARRNSDVCRRDADLAEKARSVAEETLAEVQQDLESARKEIGTLEQRVEQKYVDMKRVEEQREKVTAQLEKSASQNEILQRTKSALADEVRRVVADRDQLSSARQNDAREIAKLRHSVEIAERSIKELEEKQTQQRKEADESAQRRLDARRTIEEQRMEELKRSFETRCRELMKDRNDVSRCPTYVCHLLNSLEQVSFFSI